MKLKNNTSEFLLRDMPLGTGCLGILSTTVIIWLSMAGITWAQTDGDAADVPANIEELVAALREGHAKAAAMFERAQEKAEADAEPIENLSSPWEFAQRYVEVAEADGAIRPAGVEDPEWKAYLFGHYYLVNENNHPVSGTIKVQDQKGEPVIGAELKLKLSFQEPSLHRRIAGEVEGYQAGRILSRSVDVRVQSSDDGLYQFQDWPVSSAQLIAVEDSGIIPQRNTVLATAAPRRGHPADAAPIRLDATVNVWRIQPPDGEVVEHSKSGYLKASEEGYYLNLTTGEFVDDPDNADLSIIYRFDDDVPDNHESWSVELRALEGGVQESASAFLFEAPLDGYRPVFTQGNQGRRQIRQTKHNEPDHKFYVRARDGAIYSALEWRAVPWRDGTLQYTLQWRSNLEGGRLLQPPGAASSDE